jgi:hypothetical protein
MIQKMLSRDLGMLIVACIIVVAAATMVLYFLRMSADETKEGFYGQIPFAVQESGIPNDMPGAVTSDPTVAKPSTTDLISAQQAVEGFQDMFAGDLFEGDDDAELLMQNAPKLLQTIEQFIEDPENTALPSSFESMIASYRNKAALSRRSGRAIPSVLGPSMPAMLGEGFMDANSQPVTEGFTEISPTRVGANSDVLTMADLEALIRKVNTEIIRLNNLRSESPTVNQKIKQLTEMANTLKTYKLKVDRQSMTLAEIPIKPADAKRFLDTNLSDSFPALLTASPIVEGGKNASSTAKTQTIGTIHTEAVNTMDMLQALKWSLEIKIDNDPAILERDKILRRIEHLEQRIAAHAYSETPIPKSLEMMFNKELAMLSNALTQAGKEGKAPWDTRVMPNVQNPGSEDVRLSYIPEAVSDTHKDTSIRPGFEMNNETIARRASASAFDDSMVGGADYKKMTLVLCSQIQSAQLGEPKNFGCISNPDAVSHEYSWRGTYQMVCNRLGDTWGSWYPEMFGCGKYDPQQRYMGLK